MDAPRNSPTSDSGAERFVLVLLLWEHYELQYIAHCKKADFILLLIFIFNSVENEKPFCTDCHLEKFAERCSLVSCKKPIPPGTQFLVVDADKFHKGEDLNQRPIDKSSLKRQKCPIQGRNKAGFWKFFCYISPTRSFAFARIPFIHVLCSISDCFNCSGCEKNLADEAFVKDPEGNFCAVCAESWLSH